MCRNWRTETACHAARRRTYLAGLERIERDHAPTLR